MKTLLIGLSLFAGQMITLQEKPVVHLSPNKNVIFTDFGGKLLELINAPAVISLPIVIPKTDAQGIPWSVDVKNMGPHAVTVTGRPQFSLAINVGQTVHISSNGSMYSSLPCRSPCTQVH